MNFAKILIYLSSIISIAYSSTNALADSSSAKKTVQKEIVIEISRNSLDKIDAAILAQKNFLNDPSKYLGGGHGITYKNCKVKKKSASVYKKPGIDESNDILNDMWNVTLSVTCTQNESNSDVDVGNKTINSSGRSISKENELPVDEQSHQQGEASILAK